MHLTSSLVRSQKVRTAFKSAVTVILVVWLLGKIDWPVVVHILTQASWPLLIGYCGLQLVGNLISAVKWQYLARLQNFRFSISDTFFAYLSGAFINNFLPSTIGGDTYRVFWMSRIGERAKAFSVVFFDRITGLLGLFLLSGIGILSFPWKLLASKPAFIILAAIIFSVVLLILAAFLWTKRLYLSFIPLVRLFPSSKLLSIVESFSVFMERAVYGRTLLWSLLFMLIGVGASNTLLFRGLGVDLPLGTFLSAIFVATLVANIPISINNIGVKEWSYVFFFGLVGVSAEVAVTAALASRLLQMLLSFLAVPHYLRFKNMESIISSAPQTLPKEY